MLEKRELNNWKLRTLTKIDIEELAVQENVSTVGSHGDIAVRLIDTDPDRIDAFIKRKYNEKPNENRLEKLITKYVCSHPKIVPSLKDDADIIFSNCRYRLVIAQLPQQYDSPSSVADPAGLARWMYENLCRSPLERHRQGFLQPERRLYIILANMDPAMQFSEDNFDTSSLKRIIDDFIDNTSIDDDIVVIIHRRRSYVAWYKLLIIA